MARSICWKLAAVVGMAVSSTQAGLGRSRGVSARAPACSRKIVGLRADDVFLLIGLLLFFLRASIHENDAQSFNYLLSESTAVKIGG